MKFKLGILGICIFGYITIAVSLRNFTFTKYCVEDHYQRYQLSMIGEDVYGGKLKFKYEADMPRRLNCTVIIGARGFEDRDRMFFYITRFDLGDACGPGKTWLSVVEGDLTTDPRPISGLPTRLCGRSTKYLSTTFTTSWRHLQVEYHGNNPDVGSGFEIVFKHFGDPPCYKLFEYSCDNGRCIHNKLKCNGDDPCGDGSDCTSEAVLSIGTILGIVGASCSILGGCAVACPRLVKYCKSRPTPYMPPSDRIQHLSTRLTTSEHSRAPYAMGDSDISRAPDVPQHERRNITNRDAAEPPSYSSLIDNTNGFSDVRPSRNDVTRPDNGAMADDSVSPPVPVDTEVDTDQNDSYMPPPPSYDIAMTYKDIYKVSEQEQNETMDEHSV